MHLTHKFLGYLYRAFDKRPDAVLALRLRYSGTMSWMVADGVLSTTVSGGPGAALSVDLASYTLRDLVSHLAAQPGYTVTYLNADLAGLSARVLVDGTGDQDASNGDWLLAYQSLLWAYLEPLAVELRRAKVQIGEMLRQMNTKTAEGEWLDLLGNYYAVPRLPGETDSAYGPRIIIETLRPRSNNVAIAQAIKDYSGQTTTVTDVVVYGDAFPLHNAAIAHNAAHQHNAAAAPVYGLFDVEVGYDLESGAPPDAFRDLVAALANRLRAAGTQLRSVALTNSTLVDALTAPTDGGNLAYSGGVSIADALTAPVDASSVMPVALKALTDTAAAADDATDGLIVTFTGTHNGVRRHDGAVYHASGIPLMGALAGEGAPVPLTVWDGGATSWDNGNTLFVGN